MNPKGVPEEVECRFNNDKNLTYSCSYVPKSEGVHKVFVKFSGRDIPKSPYDVKVEGHAGDATKVTASGPGLQPDGVCVNRPTYFDISAKGAGRGVPEVIILDPAGHKTTVAAKLRQLDNEQWRCEYTSGQLGLHSVNVFFAGQPIPNSPYGVRVSPVSDARKVRASGRGIQPTGVRVGDDGHFKVHTDGAGEGTPEVKVIGPGGVTQTIALKKLDGTTYEGKYVPTKDGRYRIMMTYGGQEIPKSPFDVAVGPKKVSSIVAFGPGLTSGVVGYPACFVVETNGETGALGFSIAGPSQAEIECHDNGDGSALVKYHPTAPGEYAVHILCDNEDIPKSPHMAYVLPRTDFHPELVKTFGPGLQSTGVVIDKPVEFSVDARKAGNAPLEIVVQDIFGKKVPFSIKDNADGTQTVTYSAKSAVSHTVEGNYFFVKRKI
jgi:filamin